MLLFVALCFGAWVSWRRQGQAPSEPGDVVDLRERMAPREREPAGV